MKKGFSLVELIIVVSIIAILTAVIIPNLRKGEEVFALQRAVHKLAQDLRVASEIAMSGRIVPTPPFPPGGYGIYFSGVNTNQYILFRDNDNQKDYDVGEEIENLSLAEKGVIIESISPATPLSIVFYPPDPTVTIKNIAGTFSEAIITLKQRNDRLSIRVNSAGLIEIFKP